VVLLRISYAYARENRDVWSQSEPKDESLDVVDEPLGLFEIQPVIAIVVKYSFGVFHELSDDGDALPRENFALATA
jgi:hypothetical protein